MLRLDAAGVAQLRGDSKKKDWRNGAMGVSSVVDSWSVAGKAGAASGGARKMGERQRRSDINTANAVARGVNIFAVRNHALARNYMEYKQVPPRVITRVLDESAPRRVPTADQAVSEAIVPSSRPPADE